MANNKTGFGYYSIDTDRYQDLKIKKLKHKYGVEGIAVYDYILCEIYRDKGCYVNWNEFIQFDIADYFQIKEESIEEILNWTITIGLFDKMVFDKFRIITSRSIQDRYLDMCVRSKRKNRTIPKHIQIAIDEITQEYEVKITEESPKITEETNDTLEKMRKKPEPPKQIKKEPELSSIPESFREIVSDWLAYKKSRKETYKSDQSIKAFYNKLNTLSAGDPEKAKKIIEQSMANNWAGIFELKEYGANWRNNQSTRRKEELFAEAAEISGRVN